MELMLIIFRNILSARKKINRIKSVPSLTTHFNPGHIAVFLSDDRSALYCGNDGQFITNGHPVDGFNLL